MNAPGLVQEYWRHKPTGRLWAVELFGGRVIRAIGPLGDDEIDHRVLPYLPYTRRDTRWLNEHRAEFVRAARASDP